jgi:hypothetical protein
MARFATTRRRIAAHFLAGAGVSVGLLVSCQVIVPGDVPTFQCVGSDPSSCPSGLACDPERGICVSPNEVGEGGVDGRVPFDTGTDVKPSKKNLGDSCGTDSDCVTGLLCGSSTLLTSAITRDQQALCTKSCCTSADCPANFVCYATGTGGNYCAKVTLARDSTQTTGNAAAGASCSSGSDCRSGLCTKNQCMDTCCSDAACGNGTVCQYTSQVEGPIVAGQPSKHDAWMCAPVTEQDASAGTTCGANPQCANENCALMSVGGTHRCSPTCCSAADCASASPALATSVCAYGTGNGDFLKWCKDLNSSGSVEGQNCGVKEDCQSLYCDSSTHKCGRPCCVDTDCKTGEACKPSPDSTPFLRCVAN